MDREYCQVSHFTHFKYSLYISHEITIFFTQYPPHTYLKNCLLFIHRSPGCGKCEFYSKNRGISPSYTSKIVRGLQNKIWWGSLTYNPYIYILVYGRENAWQRNFKLYNVSQLTVLIFDSVARFAAVEYNFFFFLFIKIKHSPRVRLELSR